MTETLEKREWGCGGPEQYDVDRECDKCGGKVSRYTTPYTFGPKKTVVLCSPCDFKRRHTFCDDALAFVGDANREEAKAKDRKRRNESNKRRKGRTLPQYVELTGLRAVRERKGLSQEEVARRVGATQAKVSNWELGKHRVRRKTAQALARKIGARIEEMQGESA